MKNSNSKLKRKNNLNTEAILVVMNTSSENKAWKKIQVRTGFEPMTIPVQRFTN